MLVLARRKGEKIFIGGNITICVVRIDGEEGVVRIGIDAPDDVPIIRDDVLNEARKQNNDRQEA